MKTKIIKVVFTAYCLLFTGYCFSQAPKWTDMQWRKTQFPDASYLVGFASEKNKSKQEQNELLRKLEGYAKSQLGESVQVSISSLSDLTATETNGKMVEYFKKNCTSSTSLNIAGLKTETYYDQKEKTGYAIAYVKKAEVFDLYKNNIDARQKNIAQKIETSEKYSTANLPTGQAGDNQNALKNYFECFPVFREIEEAQGIYLALKNKLTDEADLKIKEITDLKIKVDKGIKTLQKSGNNTMDDICFFLSYGFNLQTGKISEPVRLTNFTYKDTKMGSEFARKFSSVFEQKLVTTAGYNVTTEAILPNSAGAQNKFLITGTYWDEGDNLKVIAILRNTEGKAVASNEAYIPVSWLKSNSISFIPENFKDAYSNMKAFKKDEFINGDLNIEVWTNKGNENVIFTKGETMKLHFRVNKECYIRVIYYLADGSKTLLLDSYYISSDKVNKIVEIPGSTFECSEPFGIETMQVNAQTTEFEKLNTVNKDGYQIIQDDIKNLLVKTMGMKRVDDKVNMKAEKRVIITTMIK